MGKEKERKVKKKRKISTGATGRPISTGSNVRPKVSYTRARRKSVTSSTVFYSKYFTFVSIIGKKNGNLGKFKCGKSKTK